MSSGHATKKPKPNTSVPTFVKVSLSVIVLFIFTLTIVKISEFFITTDHSKIPQLKIALTDTPIEQIDQASKELRYPGNSVSITANGHTDIFEDVEIKKRGNATEQYAKKPYQIKFSHKTPLFNLGANRKWVLLTNYSDHSFLRTDIAFHLQQLLNSNYPLNGQFVELYIDDNYRGLYYLTDKVEVGKNRINLRDQDGVIMELDNLYGEKEGCNYDLDHNCLVAKDFVNPDREETAVNSFMDSLNKLEQSLIIKDYNSINNLIDIDSFAQYYLISEFTVNPDAYTTSFFMYKDGGKIYAGAGWDFDAALGNRLWNTSGVDPNILHSPTESNVLQRYLKSAESSDSYANSISTIMYSLLSISEFQARIKEIYQQTLSGHNEELLDYIESQAAYIKDAAERDQKRWKLQANFDDEVDYLIDWVAKRYNHFEEVYGASTVNTTEAN